MRFIIFFFLLSVSVQAQSLDGLRSNLTPASFKGSIEPQNLEVHDVLRNTFTQASLLITEGNVKFNGYTFTEPPVMRVNETSIARIYSQTRPGAQGLERITLRLQLDGGNRILAIDFRIISGYTHTGEYDSETIEWIQWTPDLRASLRNLK